MFVFVVDRQGVVINYNWRVREELLPKGRSLIGDSLSEVLASEENIRDILMRDTQDVSGSYPGQCLDKNGKLYDLVWAINEIPCRNNGSTYFIIVADIIREKDNHVNNSDYCLHVVKRLQKDANSLLVDRLRNALAIIDAVFQLHRHEFSKEKLEVVEKAIEEISSLSSQYLDYIDRMSRELYYRNAKGDPPLAPAQ